RRRRSLERGERMRGTARAARLIALRQLDLLRLQTGLAVHRGPRRRRMAAAKKLLIDRLVAASAVSGAQPLRPPPTPGRASLLPVGRLMATQAVDASLRVPVHLELVHDGILLLRVALGAFACRARQRRGRLAALDRGPCAVDEERADDQREGNDDGDENGTE